MTGSLDAGIKLVSIALAGAESMTTLPFVICSFIFFSSAVSEMLDVTATAGTGVLVAPLFNHSRKRVDKQRKH